MTSILYRFASIDDLEQLNDLHIVAYSEFEKSLPEDGWAKLSASLHDKNKLLGMFSHAQAFIAETANQIVGMAFLVGSGNATAIYPAEWSYIRMVGVHPAFRGQGIGKKLTSRCIDQARKNGEKIIGLHTSEIMDAARHIYESTGFTLHQEIDRIFGVRYWLYKMDL